MCEGGRREREGGEEESARDGMDGKGKSRHRGLVSSRSFHGDKRRLIRLDDPRHRYCVSLPKRVRPGRTITCVSGGNESMVSG